MDIELHPSTEIIDTTKVGATKTDMFSNCGVLTQPDAAAIVDLKDAGGANWTHPTTCL